MATFAKPRGCTTKILPLKKELYGISYAPENHECIYYFLLVHPGKENAFRSALSINRPFDVRGYASIVAAQGEPPPAIREELQLRYKVSV